MSEPRKIEGLLASLRKEIARAAPGSTEGQVPMLDLLGQIRDEARTAPKLPELESGAEQAWERLAGMLEAGQSFTAEHIDWLRDLDQSLAGLAREPENDPAQSPEAAPPEAEEGGKMEGGKEE